MDNKKNNIIPFSEKDFLAQAYGGSGKELQQPFDTEIFLLETHIAGPRYREGYPENIRRLKKGMPLTLIREPENRYDDLAILILDDRGDHLGYVPRERNAVLARLMDAGKYLYARVEEINEWNGEAGARYRIFMRDYAPLTLNAAGTGNLLPKPEHPVRTDSEAFRMASHWVEMMAGLLKDDSLKKALDHEEPLELLKGDLVCFLMTLLKTDIAYIEEDAPVAYDLIRTYLSELNLDLPERFSLFPEAERAVHALLHGKEMIPVPETVTHAEAIDRKLLKKENDEEAPNLTEPSIFYICSLMLFVGTNFLSIYNHSVQGKQALDHLMESLRKRMNDYVGANVKMNMDDAERLKETELYVGSDGLKGWIRN